MFCPKCNKGLGFENCDLCKGSGYVNDYQRYHYARMLKGYIADPVKPATKPMTEQEWEQLKEYAP